MLNVLLGIIAVPFVVAASVALLPARWAGRISLVAPAAVLALALPLWRAAADGGVVVPAPWLPSLGVTANLRVDPLGAVFVVLIGAIGLAVVQYARHYLGDKAKRSFWTTLLAFMGSMLGIVLSDSLLLLFVFWELTTITSALLIGADFQDPAARLGAIQAFLVTSGGGLALLVGVVLLGRLAGTHDISGLELQAGALSADPAHTLPLFLVLVGAFTKSAQFPFHFWLPGAMTAPAPVSAYLHSATMVKAGVFLVARLHPVFHASPLWLPLLTTVGLATFLIAGWQAVRAWDLKQLLAFTTAAYLGLLMALFGLHARADLPGQTVAIVSHAIYKSSLFLLIGWLEKATGTRDLRVLRRERWYRREPIGCALLGVGALAMAGAPLTLGFVTKEVLFQSIVAALPGGAAVTLAAAVVAGALSVTYALKLSVSVFWGAEPPKGRGAQPPRKVSPWLLAIPAILLTAQLVGGVAPALVVGAIEPGALWPPGPAIWHHLDVLLWLGLVTYAAGIIGYVAWRRLATFTTPGAPGAVALTLSRWGLALADAVGRGVQAGGHPRYVAITFAFAAVALGVAVIPGALAGAAGAGWGPDTRAGWLPTAAIVCGAVLTVTRPSRITKALMMAIAGYGTAVMYVLYRAPDLVLTQILVETVALVLLLLIFRRLPPLSPDPRPPGQRAAHAAVAASIGALMAMLAWTSGLYRADRPAGVDAAALSLPVAGGRNVVNVILVDIRGVDTLGEITVLAIAALGAMALLGAGRRAAARGVRGAEPAAPAKLTAMRSLILGTVARGILPVTTLFALYLLLRGHNAPGGGFIAGLVTSAAMLLESLALGFAQVRRSIARSVRQATWLGVSLAALTGVLATARRQGFLAHESVELRLGPGGPVHLSTTLVFDIGVYLVMVGVTATLLDLFAGEAS